MAKRISKRTVAKVAPTAEIGTTGLKRSGGIILEEFHKKLQGDKALEVYTEMLNNSPTVHGVLFAIDMHMRRVPWRVEPGGESAEDLERAEFIDSCRHDMSSSWEDVLSEILTMIPYGWSYHETVYKYRSGGDPLSPGTFSRFTDGLLGWRKLPIRAQTTRWKWEIDDTGGIAGMWQLPVSGRGPAVFIPIQKALLFRPRAHKNNPEGKSALRAAYKPYYYSTRIMEIEAVGIERDLEGFPVIKIPGKHIAANDTVFDNWKKAGRNLRRNEQECIVLPSDVDPESKIPYYEVQLLSTGSRRQFDLNTTIERYDKRIALTVLADFLFLGQQGVGSHAQTKTRASMFATALDAWNDSIADVFNRHAIPRLLALNGMSLENPPTLCPEPAETPDLAVFSSAVASLAGSGMPVFPDPKVENVIRSYLGLPEMTPEEMEDRERQDEEDDEVEWQVQEQLATQPQSAKPGAPAEPT